MADVSGRRDVLWRVATDYLRPHLGSLALGTLFLLATNWLSVEIPLEIGAAVDLLSRGESPGVYALRIAIMGVAVMCVRTFSRVLFFNPGRDVEYRLRQDVFEHLMVLQPSFFARHRTGDLVSRASNDITWARALIGFGSLQIVNVAFAISLAGWKMVSISPRLTLLTLLPVLLGLLIVQVGIARLFTLQKRNQEELGAIGDQVLGSFQGVATIQSFVAEDAFAARFEEKNRRWFETGMKLAFVRSSFLQVLPLGGGLAVFALLFAGGPAALGGLMSVGDLAAFATLLATLLPPLRSLGWMLSVVQRGRASLERIFELLDEAPERPEGQAGRSPEPGGGPRVEVRDLRFAYPDAPDREVLRGVDLDVPAGAVVGLFGRTGSGKSTLLGVLARLHNPPRGAVRIDGVDLLDLDLNAWRRRIGVVAQRPYLFSDTIAANVALSEEPDPERVRRAVALAALEPDLAALPRGLETVVGDRGILLSGGQRQRVALARGLYRSCDLLLLDDVLSAVDHQTEARLLSALADVSARARPPTTFIASHRLSALRHADLVLVLDEGRVIDRGTHDELASRPGPYRDAWLAWQEHDPAEAAS